MMLYRLPEGVLRVSFYSRHFSSSRGNRQNWVLLGIVLLGLVIHLGGRYTSVVNYSGAKAVSSGDADARHQHLASDGAQWHPPAAEFSLFLETICTAHVPAPSAPPLAVHVDESLYNRPPPTA